jgi:hypothetical protein
MANQNTMALVRGGLRTTRVGRGAGGSAVGAGLIGACVVGAGLIGTIGLGAGCAFDPAATGDDVAGSGSALDAIELARNEYPQLVPVGDALAQGAASGCAGLVRAGDVVVRSDEPGLVVVMQLDLAVCVDDAGAVAHELRERGLLGSPDALQRVFVLGQRLGPLVEVRTAGDPSPQPSSPGRSEGTAPPPQAASQGASQGSMQSSAESGGVGVGGTKGDPSPQPSDRSRPVEGEPSPQPSQPVRFIWSL